MPKICYRKGDATNPVESGKIGIFHIVNSLGGWGSGFVIPLGQKYPQSKKDYLNWYNTGQKQQIPFMLGEVFTTTVSNDLYIFNILAQKAFGFKNIPPIRYEALRECLIKINDFAKNNLDYIIGPRIGAKRSGGDWKIISKMIEKYVEIPVVIYDLPNENWKDTKYED